MASTALVENDIQNGQALVEQLDQEGVRYAAALWNYLTDMERWSLVIALPEYDKVGPRAGYERIQKSLRHLPEDRRLSLMDITVVSPSDPMIKGLRKLIKTPGPGIANIRLRHNWIDNVFVEDALVYRLN